MRNVFVLNVG